MSIIGYITSIPVFADSGFVIFTPLNKALTKRAGLSLSVTATRLRPRFLKSIGSVEMNEISFCK